MNRSIAFLLVVVCLFVFIPVLRAQSPEMPAPLAMVVDADGKPMVQLLEFQIDGAPSVVRVLFEFDGVPAYFEMVSTYSQFKHYGYQFVFFSDGDCQGTAYLNRPPTDHSLWLMYQTAFAIAGPDGITGEYRVFRSTSTSTTSVSYESVLDFNATDYGNCFNVPTSQASLLTAAEVLPNPLEGFHGPTVANPERLLTIRGGTRLP